MLKVRDALRDIPVLNALRHLRFGQLLDLNRQLDHLVRAQRLTASKVWADAKGGLGQVIANGAQRLTASKVWAGLLDCCLHWQY